jgi:hypothetical protein
MPELRPPYVRAFFAFGRTDLTERRMRPSLITRTGRYKQRHFFAALDAIVYDGTFATGGMTTFALCR